MLHISKSDTDVITAAADFITAKAQEAVRANKKFTWALSGGSSPRRLFELLTTDAYAAKFPWKDTYFFFGDERNVSHESEESNFRMARIAMLDPMNIPSSHIFPVDTSLKPDNAAQKYESDIRDFFRMDSPAFDLIMLGLGDDAHTASLFPGTDIIDNHSDLVASVFLPDKQVYRISFTSRLINQGKTVAFLTFGNNKAEAVTHVFGKYRDHHRFPAQLIKPASGDLHWFLDEAAASGIQH